MKHFDKLVENMEEQRLLKEVEQERSDEQAFMQKMQMKSIGYRLHESNVYLLDHLCKRYGLSRSSFSCEVIESAIYDLLEKLGEDPFEIKKECLMKKMQSEKENN